MYVKLLTRTLFQVDSYNDLRGTAAADIADGYMNSLQKYLMDTYEKYNSERYVCRGCTI